MQKLTYPQDFLPMGQSLYPYSEDRGQEQNTCSVVFYFIINTFFFVSR